MRLDTPTRKLAFAFGAVYVAVGLAGFAVTGFSVDGFVASAGQRLLVFDLNPFHNVVHLGIGGLWLLGSQLDAPGGTEQVHLGIGAIYILAGVLGFVGALDLLSITAPLAADNFLHLATGVAAVVSGAVVGDLDGAKRASAA